MLVKVGIILNNKWRLPPSTWCVLDKTGNCPASQRLCSLQVLLKFELRPHWMDGAPGPQPDTAADVFSCSRLFVCFCYQGDKMNHHRIKNHNSHLHRGLLLGNTTQIRWTLTLLPDGWGHMFNTSPCETNVIFVPLFGQLDILTTQGIVCPICLNKF